MTDPQHRKYSGIIIDTHQQKLSNIAWYCPDKYIRFVKPHMNNVIKDLYSLLDLRLELIAEKILLSKVNDSDDVYQTLLAHVEDVFIQAALRISGNNISQAARLLGINRNTLSKRLRVSDKAEDTRTASNQRRNGR